MRPCSDRRHDLPAETLTVRAFLHPETQFRRFRVALFQRGHAKAFLAVAPSDDKGKCIWLRSLQSLFASRHVFAPGRGLPPHESGDRGRDACENLFCVRYLTLAELESPGLDHDHLDCLAMTHHASRILNYR